MDKMLQEAVDRLQACGILVPAEAVADVQEALAKGYGFSTAGEAAYSLLIVSGLGNIPDDAPAWTPFSHQVYAFDAEVSDVENMYTLFLQGMQAIIPEIVIRDVTEDLSGMTDEVDFTGIPTDGQRSVSFSVNGHPYSVTLQSRCDWFHEDMLVFFADVLRREGCRGTLHRLSEDYDQMVLLFYGTEDEAQALLSALR